MENITEEKIEYLVDLLNTGEEINITIVKDYIKTLPKNQQLKLCRKVVDKYLSSLKWKIAHTKIKLWTTNKLVDVIYIQTSFPFSYINNLCIEYFNRQKLINNSYREDSFHTIVYTNGKEEEYNNEELKCSIMRFQKIRGKMIQQLYHHRTTYYQKE